MSLKPRAYQSEFVDGIRLAMMPRKYKDSSGNDCIAPGFRHICGYLPQGGGKSVVAAMMTMGAATKNNSTLILTHREEILKQNFNKMDMFGLKPTIVNANTKNIPDAQLCVGMSQTIAARCTPNDKRINKPFEEWRKWVEHFDIILVDEPHRGEHDGVLMYARKETFIIGFTASITRAGNGVKQLGEFYDCIVKGITTKELISLGYLVKSKNYTYPAPKLDDIPITKSNGDYNQQALQNRFGKKERYAGVISNWLKICPDTKTIVFTTGAKHAISLCMAFNEMGVPAKYLLSEKFDGTDTKFSGPRTEILNQFRDGLFKVLINISILDTGYDEPSIQTVVLDMATESYTKYSQCVGRGSRPFPGKEQFNVLDFGGNVERHGVYEREDPPMSLWHNKTKPGVPPTKECPLDKGGCGRLIPISAKDCPYCGYHFTTSDEIYKVELREFIEDAREDQMDLEVWCAKMVEKGKKINWILSTICIKNCDNPHAAFMRAIRVLRTKNGRKVSPEYWKTFKKYILRDQAVNKQKRDMLERKQGDLWASK